MGQKKHKNGFDLTVHPQALEEPYKRKKPTRILCCSMGDLFHKDVPLDYIQQVFKVICENPQHLFMIVTKRIEILNQYHSQLTWPNNLLQAVSVEHPRYNYRLKLLQETNAKHKVAFFEPLLEDLGDLDLSGIVWAFMGGESGKNSRPCKAEWVENLRDQCETQQVSFTFKQWGGRYRKRNGSLLHGQYYHDMPLSNQVRIYNMENCPTFPVWSGNWA